MGQFIVSANYRDRGSPYKWLIRERGKPLSSARACKQVERLDHSPTPMLDALNFNPQPEPLSPWDRYKLHEEGAMRIDRLGSLVASS